MVRFGLFGAGFIGEAHAANIHANRRTALAVLYDPDKARAEAIAGRCGATVAERPEDVVGPSVDAVLIASATDAHADQLTMAARAGKAVLCEKPIHGDSVQAWAAVETALAAGVPSAVGFNRRYAHEHGLLRRAVADGRLGAPEAMHIIARTAKAQSPEYLRISGGLFHVSMTHYFDLACWLLGDLPTEIFAYGGGLTDPVYAAADQVDTAMVLMKMPSGALVHIENGFRTTYGYDERIEIIGAAGLGESGRIPLNHFRLSNAEGRHESRYVPDWFERMEHTYMDELDAFVDMLEGAPQTNATLADGLRAQVLADAAQASMVEGRPAHLDWTRLTALGK